MSNLTMPSGLEVESATFNVPVTSSCASSGISKSSGLQSKLNDVASKVTGKYNEVKPVVDAKIANMKLDASRRVAALRYQTKSRVSSMREGASLKVESTQTDMRTNPMKWAGIAAGTGIGLGLLARLMDHRKHKHVRKAVPQLVIIEAAC